MKFKTGDKVVIVKPMASLGGVSLPTKLPYGAGDEATVLNLDELATMFFNGPCYRIKLKNGADTFVYEDEIEHAHIVNSPLYKALS